VRIRLPSNQHLPFATLKALKAARQGLTMQQLPAHQMRFVRSLALLLNSYGLYFSQTSFNPFLQIFLQKSSSEESHLNSILRQNATRIRDESPMPIQGQFMRCCRAGRRELLSHTQTRALFTPNKSCPPSWASESRFRSESSH
jgi:hypothetical protein